MSSDRYGCAGCEKYFHELDMVKDQGGALICKECEADYANGRTPRKAIKIATPYLCTHCSYRSAWSFAVCGKCSAHGSCLDTRQADADPKPLNAHYKHGSIDPCQYVEAMGDAEYRGACILNILKYITRYPHKGTPMEDLMKAQDYVNMLIEHQKKKESKP
jgi:hypothetical protein